MMLGKAIRILIMIMITLYKWIELEGLNQNGAKKHPISEVLDRNLVISIGWNIQQHIDHLVEEAYQTYKCMIKMNKINK